ncbi:hypothetical protein F6I22_08550 [Streptococcus anginosus]|nr:hypothetical protein F6I22_08550 [Streptococcus anginosus]
MRLAKQANIKKKLGRKFPASKYKVYSYNKPTTQLLIAQQSSRLLSNPARVRLGTKIFKISSVPLPLYFKNRKKKK